MQYTQTQILDALVASAHAAWARNVHEPTRPGEVSAEITRLWDASPFWGRWLRERCPAGYTRPPDPDYCGIFAMFAARNIGDHIEPGRCVDVGLNPEIAKHVMSSTYRLAAISPWRNAGFEPPASLPPEQIRGGHIVTVNPTPAKPYGTHIVIAACMPDNHGDFKTYEGNATGQRGDGSRGKGVVVRTRNTKDVARVWQLAPEHFTGAAQ